MAWTQASKAIGAHAAFARDGEAFTLPAPGTVGRAAKPGPTDTVWYDLGVIEEFNITREDGQNIEIFAPTPGQRRLYDEITIGPKLKIAFTCSEVGPLQLEMMFRSLKLTTGAEQFNPLEGVDKKGWFKGQFYDQSDGLRLILDTYAKLKVTGDLDFGGGGVLKPKFEILCLHSTLNTGQLS
jgi:hypothetical protein